MPQLMWSVATAGALVSPAPHKLMKAASSSRALVIGIKKDALGSGEKELTQKSRIECQQFQFTQMWMIFFRYVELQCWNYESLENKDNWGPCFESLDDSIAPFLVHLHHRPVSFFYIKWIRLDQRLWNWWLEAKSNPQMCFVWATPWCVRFWMFIFIFILLLVSWKVRRYCNNGFTCVPGNSSYLTLNSIYPYNMGKMSIFIHLQ